MFKIRQVLAILVVDFAKDSILRVIEFEKRNQIKSNQGQKTRRKFIRKSPGEGLERRPPFAPETLGWCAISTPKTDPSNLGAGNPCQKRARVVYLHPFFIV
uniref:Uncharacterized protein n=1 Tax=Solanum tuberosum TaxID=4113 RepID=M1DGU7_SOLTU